MLSTAFAYPGASVAPRARYRARRARVPPLRAATTDEAAEKRKNPSLYDGSANTAADAGESSIASTSSAGPAHGPREIVKPEILAPAGGWPQMRAAVEAGEQAALSIGRTRNPPAHARGRTSQRLQRRQPVELHECCGGRASKVELPRLASISARRRHGTEREKRRGQKVRVRHMRSGRAA